MHLDFFRAVVLGMAMSGLAGAAAAQSTCLQEGLYLEEALPYTRGDGSEEPGTQKLYEYRVYQGKTYVADMETSCLGGTLSAHEILSVGRDGWRRSTPPDPVIAAINALQLPIHLTGSIGPDGRGMVDVTRFWFWWEGDTLQKHETFQQSVRLTRLDQRLLLLRKDAEPLELVPNGTPVELPSDQPIAFEVEILNLASVPLESVPGDAEKWIYLDWVPGIPQAEVENGTFSFRGFKATPGGKASLRTQWLTPKIVTEVNPEEWANASNLLIQAGQTIETGLIGWGKGKQTLIFTQSMPEPKELYFVRLLQGAETRIDPATATPGDDLRVVAVYDADVAIDSGSVKLNSGAETLSVGMTRTPDDPRMFKSGIIRIAEAPVEIETPAKVETPVEPATPEPDDGATGH